MKIRPLGAELFHADGQTGMQEDMTKLLVPFRHLVNEPEKEEPTNATGTRDDSLPGPTGAITTLPWASKQVPGQEHSPRCGFIEIGRFETSNQRAPRNSTTVQRWARALRAPTTAKTFEHVATVSSATSTRQQVAVSDKQIGYPDGEDGIRHGSRRACQPQADKWDAHVKRQVT
jgi:hypothetical protein